MSDFIKAYGLTGKESQVPAVAAMKVFALNKRQNAAGTGTDWYESAVAQPDKVMIVVPCIGT